MNFATVAIILFALILVSLLYTYYGPRSGFRGGGEAIGGRTGGSAYSGAGADLVE